MKNNSFGLMNTFTLKLIAVITMVLDHIGFYLDEPILRAIGRISFPIFCFLIVEGFHHTRSHMNYLIRLLGFAILSEVPFDLVISGTVFSFEHQNVFFTLALGLASIFCLEEMNVNRIYAIPLVIMIGASHLLHCDYGIGGVLLIIMFYLTRHSAWMRLVLSAFILYMFFGPTALYGMIALIPITLYNGKRGPAVQMFFYWFYPLHLLALYLIFHYLT